MINSLALLSLLPSLLALPHSIPVVESRSGYTFPIASFQTPSAPVFEWLTSDWPTEVFTKLGGFSPWFPTTGVYGVPGHSGQVPDSCTVDQVQMYMRHGEREASGGTSTAIYSLAAKIANSSYAFQTNDTNLQYLQQWTWDLPAEYLSPLGGARSFAAGAGFYQKYSSLLPENAYFNWTANWTVPVRSTNQQRVNATANAFVNGFLGVNWAEDSTWLVTPDSVSTFNSTLASANCAASSTITSQANSIFNAYFQALVVERLSPLMPGFDLTTSDVAEMMNACSFDSFRLQRPSPICSIFTEEEWLGYNYAYDLTQFDNAGYGGPIGAAWGVGWVSEMIARLNNTAVIPVGSVNTTLDADPETFPLNMPIYLDFGHDTGLESIITAMGLLEADFNGNVTLDTIDANRAWQSALISPMGGRLVVERLSCASGGSSNSTFVRLILNEAVLPLYTLPECNHSWGADQGMCELSSFLESQSYALSGADFANCANNYTGVAL